MEVLHIQKFLGPRKTSNVSQWVKQEITDGLEETLLCIISGLHNQEVNQGARTPVWASLAILFFLMHLCIIVYRTATTVSTEWILLLANAAIDLKLEKRWAVEAKWIQNALNDTFKSSKWISWAVAEPDTVMNETDLQHQPQRTTMVKT